MNLGHISKTVMLSGVAICALLAALVVIFVRAAVSQRAIQSDEGYFAPVYSPDGQYVYFVERSTSGTVEQKKVPGLFTAPEFDVQVAKDRFILKRLHVANGQVEELRRLPPSPIEGLHYESLNDPFYLPGVRLRFTEDHKLEFKVCMMLHHAPTVKEYLSSALWVGDSSDAEITDAWKPAACQISGYDEWPIFGDWELLEVRRRPFFPVAIVAYNHVTRDVRVLVKNKKYDQFYPNGVPVQQIVENSRRAGVERDQTVRRVYKELLNKYRTMGMGENQAGLQAGKEMQRLGYFPKSTMIVARRLSRTEAARNLNKDALFKIAKGEMESGIFYDIEKAIARPGEEIDKEFDDYTTHRDYSTSARLNKFLKAGNTRFYVEYLGQTYELTIKRP